MPYLVVDQSILAKECNTLFSLDFCHMLHSETGNKATNKNDFGGIETAELSIQGMPTSLYTTVLQNLILGYWFHEIPVGVL